MPCWLDSFLALAEGEPESLALTDAAGQVSRGALRALVAAWAMALRRRGILPRDRLLVRVEPGVLGWAALLAAIASGATALPMPPGASSRDARRLARIWNVAGWLVGPSDEVHGEGNAFDPDRKIDVCALPRRIIQGARRRGEQLSDPFRFAGQGRLLIPDGPGTGFLHEVPNLVANARVLFEACRLPAGSGACLALPAGHWAHLVCGFGLLAQGRPIWLGTTHAERQGLAIPVDAGPLIGFSTTQQWARSLAWERSQGALSPIKHLVMLQGMTAAATFHETRRLLPGLPIDLFQGNTRSLVAMRLAVHEEMPLPGCIGYPLPGTRIRIIRNAQAEAREGRPGYLLIESALDGQELCADTGSEDPACAIHRDLLPIGWQDPQGRYFQLPRPRDLIRTGGRLVAPADLEQRLLDSGLVEEALAFGVPHPALQEAVVLMAVARPRVTPNHVREFCRATMPACMVPQRIELHHRLPGQNGAQAMAHVERDYLRLRYAGLFPV